ncbi:2,3-diaminopropionate biosynthesis protein SbnB [Streptomyces griseoviridis]|uniref:2,3-diaminopropionate biosynthesis protein SbnB n=1 Tax=Streptomyces griseoviridis TaxID=45398 RepID=A0A3Q9KTT6_STRGD|nr:2,3-diaminopropionate biosynthesis protein SbnB [Streptomyces griseoviridis]MDH6703268.1 2,3-diaminopropionate biosynthesis protein SbnB [Streptomyces sp. MAA16]QCN87251.1 2,3-diaminopropionate biosynthesis protein SbnB [Streptomyces griseoviridis]
MLIVGHNEVRALLEEREQDILDLIARAYRLHGEGRSAVPHSVFLRFPEEPANRIIGLPAYLGGSEPVAGIKWIASFPGNVARGIERASASMVLNSMVDGRPEAFIESSLISAKRTGASAALAAGLLCAEPEPTGISLVGLGPINLEVLRFTTARLPSLRTATVYDLDTERAKVFAERARQVVPGLTVAVVDSAAAALGAHPLVSLATTAGRPHMDLSACQPEAAVLHVSLRDLTVAAVLDAQNVVDDADHVCRERTSLHLAELETGGREFVHAEIGTLLRGGSGFRREAGRRVVFSPFGLGVLDLVLARWVRDRANAEEVGVRVEGFLPGGAA